MNRLEDCRPIVRHLHVTTRALKDFVHTLLHATNERKKNKSPQHKKQPRKQRQSATALWMTPTQYSSATGDRWGTTTGEASEATPAQQRRPSLPKATPTQPR